MKTNNKVKQVEVSKDMNEYLEQIEEVLTEDTLVDKTKAFGKKYLPKAGLVGVGVVIGIAISKKYQLLDEETELKLVEGIVELGE